MADRDRNVPDIIPERIELRPALSSTGDVPVFLQQNPPEPAPATEEPSPAVDADEGDPARPAETSPSTETAPSEPAPTEAPPKPDPRTARAREQDARIARLEGLLAQSIEALTAARQPDAPAQPPAPAAPQPPEPEPRPTRAQFDDPEAYDAALVEWAMANATRKMEARFDERDAAQKTAEKQAAEQRTQAEQAEAVRTAHLDRVTKFKETHADYDEVVVQPDDIFLPNKPGTRPLIQAIARSEDGPAIAYWIAQNKAEEARITSMTDPGAIMIEVGRISARLSQPKAPEVSRTPAPIEPVGNNARAAEADPNKMTAAEWAAHTGRDKPQFKPFLSSSGRPH